MYTEVRRTAVRLAVTSAVFFLPDERKRSIERQIRGHGELADLQRADHALVSYGKSGRTWLRVMLSRFYQTTYGMPQGQMLGFDNFKKRDPALPSILFTHGNYLRDVTGHWDDRVPFHQSSVCLLVRDPRDIAVSQYFQWKHRMRPRKKWLNRYPLHGSEVEIFDFIRNPDCGLPAILEWLAIWQREIGKVRRSEIVRYEDMRADTSAVLARILAFLGTPGDEEAVTDAVAFASLDNMKQLEASAHFRLSGARLTPGDRGNPDSFKTRRAKVGGWKDYFDAPQIAEIERLVAAVPGPLFGYQAERES